MIDRLKKHILETATKEASVWFNTPRGRMYEALLANPASYLDGKNHQIINEEWAIIRFRSIRHCEYYSLVSTKYAKSFVTLWNNDDFPPLAEILAEIATIEAKGTDINNVKLEPYV